MYWIYDFRNKSDLNQQISVFRVTIVILLILKYVTETNESENRDGISSLQYYRVKNDPEQVKSEKINNSNLFSWLNLKNSVRFRLWTRKNPQLAHEIKYNELETLITSNFDPRRLTKIIIHGFADTATEVGVTYYLFDLRDTYLRLADVNVILIDYSLFTIPILYYTSLPHLAALRLGEFIKFLSLNSNLKLDGVHLLGFSLGAHVAGVAGHNLNGKIGRITGLDPAGPGYHHLPNQMRLDSTDAKFVDIIHTNAGKRLLGHGHLGISEALGHVDFYPNGGSHQLGCGKPNLLNLSYKSLECSHGRAARYYIESISSPLAFPACRCESIEKYKDGDCNCDERIRIYMGEHLNQSVRGIFQLVTKSVKPFGLGPELEVMLPNVTLSQLITNSNRLSRRTVRVLETVGSSNIRVQLPESKSQLIDEALVTVNHTKVIRIRYKNTFNSAQFPNNDIIDMCHILLKN